MRDSLPSMKPKQLTSRQRLALQMTIDGFQKNEIAERLGITDRTLRNWRRLPSWDETLEVTLKQETADGNALVKGYYPMAVGILRKLALTGGDNIKLGACRTLIEAHVSLCQREEQQQVIATLEQQMEELRVLAQVKTLAASPEPAIDVEIGAHAHADAHPAPVVVTEGQS
ncbi:MAG: hypothetical protein CL859_03155 [Cyanobium sp. ARS6]|nr:hypothetical protein [Cyanobium sp. ARS6]